jgi:peptidyl-dipeptidase Dcp
VLAIETSGEDLNRAMLVFSNLTGSNTNPTLQAIEEEYAPIFSAHNDKLYLNSTIYQRIKSIDQSKLKGEDKRLTEYYLQQFEIAGANLADDIKEKVKKINEEMATLSTQYSSKLLISRKNATVYFDSEAQLEGLSKEEIAAAQEKANKEGKTGKYAIGIINTTQQPVLQTMKNRASREKVFKASWNRAEKNDEGDVVIFDSSLTLSQLKMMLDNNGDFSDEELDQLATDVNDAIHNVIEDFLNHREG